MKTNYIVSLSPKQLNWLAETSKENEISRPEIIRRLIDERMKAEQEKRGPGRPRLREEVVEAINWVELPLWEGDNWLPKNHMGEWIREKGGGREAKWDKDLGAYQELRAKAEKEKVG